MSAVSKFQELSQVFFPQDHDLFWKNVQDGNLLSDLVFQNFISEILQEVQYYAGLNQTISSMVPPSTLSQFYFYAEIQKRLRKPDIKIDLGAGVRLFHLVPSTVHIVVEHFEQYLQHLKYSQKRSGTILIQDDAISFLGRQPTASTDLIVAIDLIEHLRKEDGLVLIKEMKRVSRGQCLIVTPLGFVPQHIDQEGDEGWGFKGNVSQKHISGWLPEEFDEWEVLVSRDFPLNTHPFGNLAAIYTH